MLKVKTERRARMGWLGQGGWGAGEREEGDFNWDKA